MIEHIEQCWYVSELVIWYPGYHLTYSFGEIKPPQTVGRTQLTTKTVRKGKISLGVVEA